MSTQKKRERQSNDNSRRDVAPRLEASTRLSASQIESLEAFINDLCQSGFILPFMKPIDEPGYLEVIVKPMDISTIRSNLSNYPDIDSALDDTDLHISSVYR